MGGADVVEHGTSLGDDGSTFRYLPGLFHPTGSSMENGVVGKETRLECGVANPVRDVDCGHEQWF